MSARTWLARHAQTLVGSLGRVVQQPLASLMTMSVIGVAIALPLLLSVLLENARSATANWNQAFDLSVYMDIKAGAGTQALAKSLRSRPDVAAVRVITAEEGMAQFRTASGFGTALDALPDNPLPDTIVVTPSISASTAQGLETLKQAIAGKPGVEAVQADTEWVNRLQAFMDIVKRLVGLTAVILGFGILLVVGNTIRLDILNRQSEIEVMKLVGATDGFARRPFLYSGALYGFGGGVLAVVVLYSAIAMLTGPVQTLASLYGSPLRLSGPGAGAVVLVLGMSVVLGWSGSWLAASRYIRSIHPT